MRRFILILMTGLLVACGDNPTNPSPHDPTRLRVINGPATCDGCGSVNLTVAGPGLNGVTDATLTLHATGTPVETTAEIRRFVGDSGLVLQIKVTFTGRAPTGDYDLHLQRPSANGAGGSLSIPAAVKVISPANGPEAPPPPPGPIGVVRVAATTTGPRPPGVYLATVTPCDPVYTCPGWRLPQGGSVSIRLNPGTYTITLADVPTNCAVAQPATVVVTVVSNQTVNASFSVACTTPVTGVLRVSAPTTGLSATPYVATVSPCDLIHDCTGSVPAGGTASLVLNTGSYTVTLGNLPPGCTVAEPRSVQVTIAQGQTVDASFSVTCPAPGTVRVTASVTGTDLDNSFAVTEGDCDSWYGYDYCDSRNLAAGATVDFTLAAGSHTITLSDIAPNCTLAGPNPRIVTVVSGVTADVAFEITCAAAARIRVSATTTGPDPDQGYQVGVGPCGTGHCTLWLDAGGFVEFTEYQGNYLVGLYDVASNCTVTGDNPMSVSTTGGATTNVMFAVACTSPPPSPPSGLVRVTAPTTGADRDTYYNVVNETLCDGWYGCWQQEMPATGVAGFTVPVGSYVFRLTDIEANCTVTVANPATVTVVANTTTELVFPVSCQ